MEHSAGDPLISAPHPERKSVEVEPLTSSCGRMVCNPPVHTLLTSTARSFSQCIMRKSIGGRS